MSDALKDEKPATMHAKPVQRRLAVLTAEPPALVPARMINEVVYCERLMYLEWSQGEFNDNAFTVDGRAVHARADVASGTLPSRPIEPIVMASREAASIDLVEEDAPPPYVARAIWLSSEKLGMTAKIDVIEGSADGTVIPIEYKRSAAPDIAEGAFLPERVQLCAQVLLLREHGYRCDHGEIYFARSRRRVRITIDVALEERTREAARRIRELTASAILPAPLVDSPKCDGCSLVSICLPDETNLLRETDLLDEHDDSGSNPKPKPKHIAPNDDSLGEFWPVSEADEEQASAEVVLRPLQPARDDRLPLYVQDQGAKISLSGEELVIKGREGSERAGVLAKARLPNIAHVSLFGNIQMTTQAVRACLERGIPISYLSSGGWFYGRATGITSKNIELRVQHRVLQDEAVCVRLARGVIASKIRNCRTLLRRNHPKMDEVVLSELEQYAKKTERVTTLASLLGIEGTAARTYFGAFSGMLKGPSPGAFDLDGRNRRPPTDPINALLSFTYSILTTELTNAVAASGLDPLLGFYHQPRFGRPALALDLMEEFRPVIADSTVIGVINNGVVGPSDFTIHPTGVALRPNARKRVLDAFERRLDQIVTHPVFGYRISYRRVLEVQARLLGRFVLGEIEAYPEFRVR